MGLISRGDPCIPENQKQTIFSHFRLKQPDIYILTTQKHACRHTDNLKMVYHLYHLSPIIIC